MSPLFVAISVLGLVALAVAIWAFIEFGRASKAVRRLSDDTSERLLPLLDKADIAIDAANAELLRIDAAITRFEDASVRVSAASGTLTEIVQHPAEVVSGVADRVRKAWKERRRHPASAPAVVEDAAELDRTDENQDL